MIVNFTLKRGMKPTEEQIRRIRESAPKDDSEIDLSDIPEITDEWFERAIAKKRAKQKLQQTA